MRNLIDLLFTMDDLDDLLDESCGDDERAEASQATWQPGREAAGPIAERLTAALSDSAGGQCGRLAKSSRTASAASLVEALLRPGKRARCAGLALRQHPDPQAMPALIGILAIEDALPGRLAGDALVAIGRRSGPALMEVCRACPARAALEAVRALATIGDERHPGPFEALDEGSALIEYWASEGLEKMGVGMRFFKPDRTLL